MSTDRSAPAAEIRLARLNLTKWIRSLATETASELGVTWRGSPCSPLSLRGIVDEFRAAIVTGLPVRVSDRYCERTIYVRPEDNIAFRFVHDSRHFFLGAGFTTEAELLVASCHLARLQADGFGPDSIEHRLLYADTVGQTLFLAETGSFVSNQVRFALRCLEGSVQQAIAAEGASQLSDAS